MSGAASSLAEVQVFLKDVFQIPNSIPGNVDLEPAVAKHVTGNDRLTPAEQADLYRRQFFMRHVDSLIEDHLGIVHYLGDDGFEAFARAYLAKFPPKKPSLRDLGADIAIFAESTDQIPEEKRGLLVDMARYELTIVELFDAADVPPIDKERLAKIPEDAWLTRPLVLTPLLRLHRFDYPVPDLRLAIKKDESTSKDLPPRAQSYYGVFRRNEQISFERLSAEAYELLSLLSAGEPLSSACDALASRLSEEKRTALETEMFGWFRRWATWGWILDIQSK